MASALGLTFGLILSVVGLLIVAAAARPAWLEVAHLMAGSPAAGRHARR